MTRRCYKVKEIKEMLGIGKNQTYEWTIVNKVDTVYKEKVPRRAS